MRKDNKSTDEQLKELYQAASDFKQVQPWKWLYDADIICVENPKDKTIGYCSVMGRGGEHYALGVYLGNEGIFGFYNKLSGRFLEKGIPREIQVRSEAMRAILDDFCKKTSIKLKVVKCLSSIDQVIEEMAYRF